MFYISHLVVHNPKSISTPVHIVFNSSQVYNGVSLNSCLAKGPDCYMNNQIRILLRWREEAVALVGDIRKMFNSVHLNDLEKHWHRFFWHNFEVDRPPDVYVMQRVNMGDTPALAISTEAIYMTADRFKEAAQLIVLHWMMLLKLVKELKKCLRKIYLCELWCLKLNWDTPLPVHLVAKWVKFFTKMFQLEKLRFSRCL